MAILDIIVVGDYQVNCYLYRKDISTNEVIIIDPGADAPKIINFIESKKLAPLAIMLTHGHTDHIGAVNSLREKYQVPLYAGINELEMLSDPAKNLSVYLDEPISIEKPEFALRNEQMVALAGTNLKILATPGHSPGGICIVDERANLVFCGDTLFFGSIGRTDFPGCSTELLLNSIKTQLLSLPDSFICYPGHGPKTTIGGERVNNPFLKGNYFV